MTKAKKRIYSNYAKEAALLIGQQIKLARMKRKWTLVGLAERAGISKKHCNKLRLVK